MENEQGDTTQQEGAKKTSKPSARVRFGADGQYHLAAFEPVGLEADCPAHGPMEPLELIVNSSEHVYQVRDGFEFWLCTGCFDAQASTSVDDVIYPEVGAALAREYWTEFFEQFMEPLEAEDQ